MPRFCPIQSGSGDWWWLMMEDDNYAPLVVSYKCKKCLNFKANLPFSWYTGKY